MQIVKINPQRPNLEIIKKAARLIKNGRTVVYPTDTCYGIGVDAFNKKAIKKVFELKERNFNRPLSVIVKDTKMAKKIAKINKKQEKYFKSRLPGRYTLIFKKKKSLPPHQNIWCGGVPDILTAEFDTIGIRIPNYLITQLLGNEIMNPYTTTSANVSRQPPCYLIQDFLKQIKGKNVLPDLILNVGPLAEKKLSKIVDLTREIPTILSRSSY
jgi:L-threonylcarbamoyladenylate synthase